jgi:AraC-like DNA-binding protein
VKDSIRVAERFSALIASPFSVSLETCGRRSIIRLDDTIPWSRTLADFAVSAWYKTHAADELPHDAKLEVCFPYAAPPDRSAHVRLFRDATLTFDAPFLGFAFDAACGDMPMRVADRGVHELVCARAETLLSSLSRSASVTRAARAFIDRATRDGDMATVESVAKKLHLSERTLSRRLESEGTTFAAELDASRQALAVWLVDQPGRSFPDIAYRLGFSHTESFFRAFKRWTGRSPSAYRGRTS